MSQLASSVGSVVHSSIRLVRDTSRPTTSSNPNFESDKTQSTDLPAPSLADHATRGAKDTTVTTSLDVASASPFSGNSQNMASRGPTTHIEAHCIPVHSTQPTIRVTKSAAAPKGTNSQLPRSSAKERIRQDVAKAARQSVLSNGAHHSHSNTSSGTKGSLPEFRQSRRWAKFQEVANAKAEMKYLRDENLALHVRETSFERQRARPKSSLQSPRSVQQAAARAIGDTDSLIQAQGLCRPLSVPTWHLMKTARSSRLPSLPAQWLARKLSICRHRRTASRQFETKGSVDMTASPRKLPLKRRLRPRKAVTDLRRKAGFGSTTSKLVDIEKIVDLDTISAELPLGSLSNSPVPSLHDPEKVKTFSQECETLLSNTDFDKDWQAVDKKSKVALRPSLDARQSKKGPQLITRRARTTTAVIDEKDISRPKKFQESSFEARNTSETLYGIRAPKPPVRDSSKAGPSLGSMKHNRRPESIPVLHGFRDGGLIGLADVKESSSTIRPYQHTERGTPTRKFSALSISGLKDPREVASTDTLSRIEAQMQDTSVTVPILGKHKQKTAFAVDEYKRPITPSGVPPERPLPDLPSITRFEETPDPSILEQSTASTSQTQTGPQMQHSDTALYRKRHQIADVKALTVIPIDPSSSTSQSSPSLPTPSSTYSKASKLSHTSTGLSTPPTCYDPWRRRSDHIRELKKRIKDNLALERRISEVDETIAEFMNPVYSPLSPTPSVKPRSPVDPIDQFPCPPDSRPQSRGSVGTKIVQSESEIRSHSRHSSKVSSIRAKQTRQVLGASEIKVLVDTDPATGNFRAGALSPSRSMATGRQDRSLVRTRGGLSKTSIGLREIRKESDRLKEVSAKKPGLRSLKSQASSHPSTSVGKLPRRQLGDNFADSNDVMYPQPSPARCSYAGATKSGRPRNSNDLQAMQKRYHDTELQYDTIWWKVQEQMSQCEQIEKTVEALTTIGHANGHKEARHAALHPVFVIDKDREDVFLSKELESINLARRRVPKGTETETTSGKPRSLSHISSASATTAMTMGSGSDEGVSLGESTTDPLEGELPNLVTTAAGSSMKPKGRASLSRSSRRGSMNGLQHPPPVVKITPKVKLPEEDQSEKFTSWDGDGLVDGNENGLSFNHSLTDTERMYTSIFGAYGHGHSGTCVFCLKEVKHQS